jgi:hypothetical protein
VGVRIDRNEMVVVDAAGVTAAQRTEFLAPGTCAVCNSAMRVEAGRSATVSGMTAAFLGVPRPGTFRFTVFSRTTKAMRCRRR